MGKINTAKTPPGDFKVTTSKIPLLSQQAITNKGISVLIPTYSWTLTQYPIGLVLEGKSGFVSHTKLTAEATFMDLFHYDW